MLDDLFKTVIVLVNEHYVNQPSDLPAAKGNKGNVGALSYTVPMIE